MPAVTRVGDADVPHCSAMVRAVGSPNVFANGIDAQNERRRCLHDAYQRGARQRSWIKSKHNNAVCCS